MLCVCVCFSISVLSNVIVHARGHAMLQPNVIVNTLEYAMLQDMRTPHLGVATILPLLGGVVVVLAALPPHLGGSAMPRSPLDPSAASPSHLAGVMANLGSPLSRYLVPQLCDYII